MVREGLDTYDVIPEDMINYLRHNGRHFNRKLCDFAVKQMTKVGSNGKEEKIDLMTRTQIDDLLEKYKVKIENKILYDYVFVANMCKADYLGSSVPDEHHLALYVKDTLDDIDGCDGLTFTRWYASMVRKGVPIDWEEML